MGGRWRDGRGETVYCIVVKTAGEAASVLVWEEVRCHGGCWVWLERGALGQAKGRRPRVGGVRLRDA